MSDIQIKTAGLSELDGVARLFRASMEDHGRRINGVINPNYDWREETRLRIERDFCRFVVAIADGRVVGLQIVHYPGWGKKDLFHRVRRRFVRVPTSPFRSPSAGTLTDLYVEPEYRRRGIGLELVKAAVELLREAGAQQIKTDVLLSNAASLALFDLTDFEPTMTRFIQKLE